MSSDVNAHDRMGAGRSVGVCDPLHKAASLQPTCWLPLLCLSGKASPPRPSGQDDCLQNKNLLSARPLPPSENAREKPAFYSVGERPALPPSMWKPKFPRWALLPRDSVSGHQTGLCACTCYKSPGRSRKLSSVSVC